MEYTLREQGKIRRFYNLYFLAMADMLNLKTDEQFDIMIKMHTPLLDEIVREFKEEHFPNEEMDNTFGDYTTNLLLETFDEDRLVEIISELIENDMY
jgi:hypothetical protein